MIARFMYLFVVLVWATTPLAIKLGGDSFSALGGLSLRIMIAVAVGCTLGWLVGYKGLNLRDHWLFYLAASVSIFPNMGLVYLAAELVPSGLISLLFGLSPFIIALLTKPVLGESVLVPRKVFAIFLACVGLAFIFYDQLKVDTGSALGIFYLLVGNLLFGLSALWVKKLNRTLSLPISEQALGSMVFALPAMLLTWYLVAEPGPVEVSIVSLGSLFYLSIIGSLGGLVAYYFILKHMTVEVVSLIPLITPVLAMILGVIVLDESVTFGMICGALVIISALAIHQQLWTLFYSRPEEPALSLEQELGTSRTL